MERKHIVSALVLNHSGVLSRVSGLFSRRGYNIESLTVCKTENPQYSRMTIVVLSNDDILEQIVKQLDKLHDVKKVTVIKKKEAVERELLIVKLAVEKEERDKAIQVADIYKAKIIDLSPASMIFELTGESDKLDNFIEVLKDFNIIELARTGLSALHRGEKSIKSILDYNDEIM